MTTTAKPTVYRSITFRSRLEARWAALFDIIGWAWEYEPEIEGFYIPDFLIHGAHGLRAYVEVKPMAVFLANMAEIGRKAEAVRGETFLILTDQFIPSAGLDVLSIGFLADEADPDDKYRSLAGYDQANLFQPGRRYGLDYDFAGDNGSWKGRLTGAYDGNSLYESSLVGSSELLNIWSRAGNAIQWKPATQSAPIARRKPEQIGRRVPSQSVAIPRKPKAPTR